MKSDDLKPESFESAAKHVELQALLESYEGFLASNNRGDMAVVYEEALQHPDWCPIQKEDCWTELPDVLWTPLQRRLIDAMPGERMMPRAFQLNGARIPRRLDSGASIDRVSPRSISIFLQSSPPPTRPEERIDAIRLFHAGGREAEIEEVFRRILQSGAPLDQVEIACASDAHVSLVWEKALRHECLRALVSRSPCERARRSVGCSPQGMEAQSSLAARGLPVGPQGPFNGRGVGAESWTSA